MNHNFSREEIVSTSLEILLKAALLGMFLFYAFSIIKPFIIPVLWAIIIAITFSPLLDKLDKKFSDKRKLIIVTSTIIAVLALIVPTYLLSESIVTSSQQLAHDIREGTLTIPGPTESVKSWPLVGENIYQFWEALSHNLKETLIQYKEQIKDYAGTIASLVGGTFIGVLQFVASLIIAAILLSKSEGGITLSQKISKKLVGEKGLEWIELSALTIRSVVQGVIGIALIQAVLSFIGLIVMDIPLAWLWALIILFLAIIQLPPWIVLGPIIAYVFSYADTSTATIFAIYSIIVSISDAFLKPLLLGRGVDIPMIVILLGAIGGMILSGILGLFVGAVGLAIAYKLFSSWLEEENTQLQKG